MSVLGPLWAWAFIDAPLAAVAAVLWWGVKMTPDPRKLPTPLDEFHRLYRPTPRARDLDYYQSGLAAFPMVTATSAWSTVGIVTHR